MEYMVLINESVTNEVPAPGSPDFDAYMGDWMAYNQKLIDGGNYVGGGRLQPSLTATTIKRSARVDQLVDGPFAETKEQLGGYYIIAAADLDEALALATAMPIDDAVIEVRPIAFRPEAL